MLGPARSLALAVDSVDATRSFYADTLDLPVVDATDREILLQVGDCVLALRSADSLPRGGSHVHYAFSVPPVEYDDWYDTLAADRDLEERTFGDARSLYCFDPAGHCVELGERGEGSGITGIFEIVLEVTDLAAATERYEAIGFSIVDRGDDRRRVRLTTGELDLELWEPQYGIANARGGVHVDFTVAADDPAEIAAALDRNEWRREEIPGGVRLRDWDGHSLTLQREPNRD